MISFGLLFGVSATAKPDFQNRYEDLLSNKSFDNYPTQQSEAEDEISIKNQLNLAIEELAAKENGLSQKKSEIESYGHSALSFYEELRLATDQLTPSEVNSILSLSDEGLTKYLIETKSEPLKFVAEGLQTARPLVKDLFSELDDYINDSIDFSMALGLHSTRERLKRVPSTPELINSYGKLIHYKNIYLSKKIEYGEGKDAQRTTAFGNYMEALRNINQQLNSIEGNKRPRSFYKSAVKVVRMLSFISPGIVIDAATFLRALIGIKQPDKATNSLMKPAMSLSRRLAKKMNLTVVVEGRENLPGDPVMDEVYIYTPTHRDALRDQIGIASLGVDNLVPFAAADNFIWNWLNDYYNLKDRIINRLNQNLGFISVGKRVIEHPITKFMKTLNGTELRNVLLYPGGRLPEGLGHTMGVREKFLDPSEGLIGQLEKEGFRVHIVPISMRYNAQFLGERALTPSQNLHVKVAPVLRDSTRRVLARLAGHDSLGLLMRYGAIEDLISNDELLWGGLRGSKMEAALDEYLSLKEESSCQNYLR